ncbi:hypothetical protein CHS0354_011357 [Potamilus streckersoni]|uniref:Uncharacterized protein n=1 Tax=Potamilus streckersoni TaxID=2493646 RepID=A0AAE0TEY7_9BIVA|nr:hypothetical protein CHS0354_011357 [Potamilus streckersoni]
MAQAQIVGLRNIPQGTKLEEYFETKREGNILIAYHPRGCQTLDFEVEQNEITARIRKICQQAREQIERQKEASAGGPTEEMIERQLEDRNEEGRERPSARKEKFKEDEKLNITIQHRAPERKNSRKMKDSIQLSNTESESILLGKAGKKGEKERKKGKKIKEKVGEENEREWNGHGN